LPFDWLRRQLFALALLALGLGGHGLLAPLEYGAPVAKNKNGHGDALVEQST
jgi:hypothetical protein